MDIQVPWTREFFIVAPWHKRLRVAASFVAGPSNATVAQNDTSMTKTCHSPTIGPPRGPSIYRVLPYRMNRGSSVRSDLAVPIRPPFTRGHLFGQGFASFTSHLLFASSSRVRKASVRIKPFALQGTGMSGSPRIETFVLG